MRLLMVTELQLSHSGKKWGVMVVDVNEDGDAVQIGFRLAGTAIRIQPFAKLALVDVPGRGPQLAFTLLGGAQQTGEVHADGSVTRTA